MIEREQVFVRAKKKEGGYGTVDVFDLDEESFRSFILTHLAKLQLIHVLCKTGEGQHILKEKGA